jgi:hypothetical protein
MIFSSIQREKLLHFSQVLTERTSPVPFFSSSESVGEDPAVRAVEALSFEPWRSILGFHIVS